MKKKHIILLLIILSVLTIAPHIVLAAKTSSQLRFCEYSGVLRTFKILGMCINIIKVVVPLLIIGTAMVSIFKTVTSGKADDLKASFSVIVKKLIAGLVIFFVPTILDFAFDTLIGYDDSGFTACSNCLLDTGNCNIPTEDPSTYED
jgi:hypothetical protein